jgi:hypothetical protein
MSNGSAGEAKPFQWIPILADALKAMCCLMGGLIATLLFVKVIPLTRFTNTIVVLIIVVAAGAAAFFVGRLIQRATGLR